MKDRPAGLSFQPVPKSTQRVESPSYHHTISAGEALSRCIRRLTSLNRELANCLSVALALGRPRRDQLARDIGNAEMSAPSLGIKTTKRPLEFPPPLRLKLLLLVTAQDAGTPQDTPL